MLKQLTVGTRGSKLAIAQTEIVVTALRRIFPSIHFSVVTIKTKGDVDKRPLFTIDRKGIFEKEINDAVIKNHIDFAVHSLKDIPSDLPNVLTIASIPKRSRPNDVLITNRKIKLKRLRTGAIIGTSSLRRAIQLIRLRSDLDVRPIRGNVETRIRKTATGEYDGIILAEAGLLRLGLEGSIVQRFNLRDFVPAPGQGSLAVICRTENHKLIELLRKIEDPQSRTEFEAEHALLKRIEGGCRFPVGAVAVSYKDTTRRARSMKHITSSQKLPVSSCISLNASIFSADGTKCIKLTKRGDSSNAIELGLSMGELLIEGGALELAKGWREAVQKWNKM
jgi:hydroxymethylbilane synthase